jgi:hypothetical protein
MNGLKNLFKQFKTRSLLFSKVLIQNIFTGLTFLLIRWLQVDLDIN